jgi:hypothetical protein
MPDFFLCQSMNNAQLSMANGGAPPGVPPNAEEAKSAKKRERCSFPCPFASSGFRESASL